MDAESKNLAEEPGTETPSPESPSSGFETDNLRARGLSSLAEAYTCNSGSSKRVTGLRQ